MSLPKSENNEDYIEMEWQRILHKKKEEFDKKYAKMAGTVSSLSQWERIRTVGTGDVTRTRCEFDINERIPQPARETNSAIQERLVV